MRTFATDGRQRAQKHGLPQLYHLTPVLHLLTLHMDDIDHALIDAWNSIAPRIRTDRAEQRQRAARRLSITLTRPRRAWCLVLRAADSRISAWDSAMWPDEHAFCQFRPHKVTLTGHTLRRACAPVHIPWPGISARAAAAKLGIRITLLNKWIKAGRLEKTKGTPYKGRFTRNLWTPSPLDPNADFGRPPHHVWGTLWRFMHLDIPLDHTVTLVRIPRYTNSGRNRRFLRWSFICTQCTPVPDAVFGIAEHDNGTPVKDLQHRFEVLDQLQHRAVKNLYLPIRPWTIADALDAEDPLDITIPITSPRPDDPSHRPEAAPLGTAHSRTPDDTGHTPLRANTSPSFACRTCHRVIPSYMRTDNDWNNFVAYMSRGLLYGHEVPRPSSLIPKRRARPARRPRAAPLQRKIHDGLCQGLTLKQIAARFALPYRAIRDSAYLLYKKSGVHGREEYLATHAIPLPPSTRDTRRHAVARLLAQGCRQAEVARRLNLWPGTVNTDTRALRQQYGAQTDQELARILAALPAGQITPTAPSRKTHPRPAARA